MIFRVKGSWFEVYASLSHTPFLVAPGCPPRESEAALEDLVRSLEFRVYGLRFKAYGLGLTI